MDLRAARPKVFVWPRDGGGKIDLSDLVVGIEATETLDPPGTCTIMLASDSARGDLLAPVVRRIKLQALVSVGFDEPGGIMLALVDSLTDTRTFSGGMVATALVLTCSHVVGKALARDNVLLSLLTEEAAAPFFDHVGKVLGEDHPVLLGLQSALGPTDGEGENRGVNLFTGRTVSEVVDWIVTQVPMMVLPVLREALGGTGRIGEYLDTTRSVTTWNDQRIYSESPQTFSGSLLAFVKNVVEPDFYEVFTTTIPNGTDLPEVALVVRPRPFDDPELEVLPVEEEPGITWPTLITLIDGLDAHVLPLDVVHVISATQTDADAFAYYVVTSAHELIGNDQQHKEGLRYPILDTYAATTFGAQSYEPRLTLVAPQFDEKVAGDVDYEGEVPAAVREFRNRIFNWRRFQPWFLSGSVTVHGRDRYRPGDKIELPWYRHRDATEDGIVAYCVGVQWQWSLGGPYLSTLRFERGQSPSVIAAAKATIADDAAQYGVDATHAGVS